MNDRTTQKLLGATVLLLSVMVLLIGIFLARTSRGSISMPAAVASEQTPAVGSDVNVYFTRESLGIKDPVSPMTDNINGTDLNIGGILKTMNPEWVVLQGRDNRQQEYWIPRKNVLWIYAYTGK